MPHVTVKPPPLPRRGLGAVFGWLGPVFKLSDVFLLHSAGLDALVSCWVCVGGNVCSTKCVCSSRDTQQSCMPLKTGAVASPHSWRTQGTLCTRTATQQIQRRHAITLQLHLHRRST